MLYALLCYNDEEAVGSWSKEEDAAVMAKLAAVNDRLASEKKLGPVARLMQTTSATTLRKSGKNRGLEAATSRRWCSTARSPKRRNSCSGSSSSTAPIWRRRSPSRASWARPIRAGAYEIRPIALYLPGTAAKEPA